MSGSFLGSGANLESSINRDHTPVTEELTGYYFGAKPVYRIEMVGITPAIVTPVVTTLTGVESVLTVIGWVEWTGWNWVGVYRHPIGFNDDMLTSVGFSVNPLDNNVYIRAEGVMLNSPYHVSIEFTKP